MANEVQKFIQVGEVLADVTKPLGGENVVELTIAVTGRLADDSTFAYIDRKYMNKDSVEFLMTRAVGYYNAINACVTDAFTLSDELNEI